MLMLYLSMLDTDEEKSKFEKIYQRYEGRMYAAAYKILNNAEEAEDVVHDSFLSVIDNLDKIFENNCHKTWNYLVTIVKNKAIDQYKRNQKHGKVSFTEQTDSERRNLFKCEQGIDRSEISDILAELILELSEQYRAVIYMYYYQEFSFAEIAKDLNISENNARQIASRARKVLAEKLSERGITHE